MAKGKSKSQKKLRRMGIGLLLVLLLVVLVLPAGVGMMAEGRYKQMWSAMFAAEPGFSAQVTDFERGWFSSTARVSLQVDDAFLGELIQEMGWADEQPDGQGPIIEIDERVHHGPIPFTAPAPFHQRWRPGFAVVESRLGDSLPAVSEHGIDLQSTTHLGLTGSLRGHLRVAAFDVAVEDELRLVNEGELLLDFQANRNLDRVSMRLRGGALHLADADGYGVHLQSPWLDVSQRRGPSDIWVGGSELRLAAIEMRLPGEGPNTMRGLMWATDTRESNDLLTQSHEIQIDALQADEFEAGPLLMDIDLFNLHPESLSRLQVASSELRLDDPESIDQDIGALMEPILDLITHEPGLRLQQLQLSLPGGMIEADGQAKARPMDRAQLEGFLAEAAWFRMMDGELQLSTSRELARRALAMWTLGGPLDEEADEASLRLMDSQLDAAIAQDMLLETDDGLAIHIELADGVLFINEREILRF
ncbi:DUF945 family protein [Gammaproteobacteria bacterium AB-CW1]|uniref:DUF945 family protein n=1 Tax=Natronospira elongata TaxID=3110268 RepID=A0AAP6MMA3_9GAMM|nr:DUF945 family protein [Gammaproteobacteria bacterium AB-CW1]